MDLEQCVVMCCQGGVRGNDADASMTAFVLIAMQEGSHLCIETVAVSLTTLDSLATQ